MLDLLGRKDQSGVEGLGRGLVDEIHLTLWPLVFGGCHAPTMADGAGILNVADATRLRFKSIRRAGSELFLVYRVQNRA